MLSAARAREQAVALRGADPETILLWAVDTFPGRAALTVSFGGGGVVLAHLLSRIHRTVPVIFLDTGFHFTETYAFKEQFAKRYGLNLIELKPLTDPGPLYKTDPDRCCFIRSEEHTSELQSPCNLVCRLLLEKKKIKKIGFTILMY